MIRQRDLPEHDPRKIAWHKAKRIGGGPKAIAARMGDITSQAVAMWTIVPKRRVHEIEAVTGVPRYELRSDLYVKWPVLVSDFGDLMQVIYGLKSFRCATRLQFRDMRKWRQVPAEHVLAFEKYTGLSRHDTRPDLYGPAPVAPSNENRSTRNDAA